MKTKEEILKEINGGFEGWSLKLDKRNKLEADYKLLNERGVWAANLVISLGAGFVVTHLWTYNAFGPKELRLLADLLEMLEAEEKERLANAKK